jgi:hypothetical protein
LKFMANSETDDVKQLSAEEKKNSREIILEAIGEKKVAPELKEKTTSKSTLGSLLGFKFSKAKKEEPAKTINQVEGRQEINKILDLESAVAPASVPAEKKVEKIIPPVKPQILNENIKLVKKPQIETKPEQLVVKKQPQPAAQIIIPPVPQKKFFPLPKKVKPVKVSQKKLGLYERRLLRSRHQTGGFSSFRDGLQENLQHFERRINIAVRQALLFALVFFIFLIITYAALIVVAIKGNLDNKPMRFVAHYIIIPALITKNGVVEYYDYLDVKNRLTVSGDSAKTTVIKEIILNDLYRKLKISTGKSVDEVNRLVIADEDINQEALDRIRKINSMLKSGDDFISVGAKYGDELVGSVNLNSSNIAQYSFSELPKDLQPGTLSEIINGTNGYFILKGVSTSTEALNVSSIFIKAKNLNDYLTEIAKNYKAISFVD